MRTRLTTPVILLPRPSVTNTCRHQSRDGSGRDHLQWRGKVVMDIATPGLAVLPGMMHQIGGATVAQWTYLWADDRVVGPMTLTEFHKLEPTLNPDARIWHPQDGWAPIWTAFAPPEGEVSSWPHSDSDSPPLPPPPPADDAEKPGQLTTAAASSRWKLRPALTLVAALVLMGGGVLLATGLSNSQGEPPVPGKASTPAIADPDGAGSDTEAPRPPEPIDLPDPGYWTGSMASGQYRYRMILRERSGGTLSARMTQTSRESGLSGTEFLSGRRSGNAIRLQGKRWSLGTPSGWSLDTIKARLYRTTDGEYRMEGTYTCPTCSGVNNIVGRIQADY